ncbi:MAG: ABC-F family ATP-binding cassette domain-containing protein [Lachnospiraceae bacterium]
MLLSANNISKSYAETPLLTDVSLFLKEGDKIGVIGVNGTGKSTLLSMLAGREMPDAGTITPNPGLQIEYLEQNPVLDPALSIMEQVMLSADSLRRNINEYEAKTILTRLGLTDFSQKTGELSGGQKKRTAIAAALLRPCDLLILDEPTNHLDNDMVDWLQDYLSNRSGAMIMVTHDRYFLDRVTTRILEIDHGALYTYDGNYSAYLELKAQREEMEAASVRKRQSFLRKELSWIQQGPQGRGTKSRFRIERFEEMTKQAGAASQARLEMDSVSTRLGRKTIELSHIRKQYDDKVLICDFEHMFLKDSRIGIVGRNGCGKTTLLQIISGELAPDTGEVIVGDTVKIGYFSQHNEALDPSLRVIDYIKNIAEYIETASGKITASQMLEKFLFTADHQWAPIGRLSGGEQRRLFLLSILISAPNILLLDEPTNDLDIQTLTILEDYLETFEGAVVTVSHDRFFLDKVVDTIFALEADGQIRKCIGGYSEYLAQTVSQAAAGRETAKPAAEKSEKPRLHTTLKMTYLEQREYESIDADIAALEEDIAALEAQMLSQSSDYMALQESTAKRDAANASLEHKMERWVYLTDLAERIEAQ